MKILIGVNSLQQGGAEKAALKLAKSFVAEGHNVQLLTWNSHLDFYEMPENVTRINLNPFAEKSGSAGRLKNALFHRLALIEKLFEFRFLVKKLKIDLFIGFESFLGSVMGAALVGTKIPVIIAERISPDDSVHPVPRLAKFLRPLVYKHGAVCSVLTNEFQKWVEDNWNINAFVTHNHIESNWLATCDTPIRNQKVVALGRFDEQKDYWSLLKSWKIIENSNNDWTLEIYGRGDITNYYHFARELQLKRVIFARATTDTMEIYDNCGVFVSSSRYEGFPNVVLEAMARRTPVIATTSTDIINEFAANNSLIAVPVENPEELASAINRLINSEELRNRFGEAAYEISKKFSWQHVSKQWQEIISYALLSEGVRWRKLK